MTNEIAIYITVPEMETIYDEETSGLLSRIIKWPGRKVIEMKDNAIDNFKNLIPKFSELFLETIENMDNKPKKVDLEFGISFSIDGTIAIVDTGIDQNFKVRLTWDNI
jgi:hypothetical protein